MIKFRICLFCDKAPENEINNNDVAGITFERLRIDVAEPYST